MVKTLYILCFLSSLWFCQAVGATPSLYEQEVSVVRSEYPSLVPIDLVYLPRKADYISGCGVRKDLKCIDAALIALILQKIYFPSLLQSSFLLQVNRIEIALIDELSNVKIQSEGFQKLAKITELRFLQKGYIPHLLHHVQQKVSAQTKNIKSGKVVTEYNGLLFAANHFLNADISLVPDITLFFCHQYKDRILPSPSADEIKGIQYLKGTLSFSTGKRPSDYLTEILKGLREKLQIFRENGEHEHIVEYEKQLKRFKDTAYLEKLVLQIQLKK